MTHHGNGAMSPLRRSRPGRGRLACVALGAAIAVAGCGAEEPVTSEVLSAEGPLSITWYGSDARNAAVQAVVDGFAAQHPDTVIESQPTAFDPYWDRLSVQAAGNNMACVASMQSRYEARYEARGSLIALDGLIADGTIDVSGIPESLLESQRAADGNLYVIPYGIWYEGAVHNVPAMEAAGVPVPESGGSWEDYVDWAVAAQPALPEGTWAISDRGGEVTQFQAFAIGRGEDLFGEQEVGFTEQTLVDWFALWTGAVEAGAAPPAATTAEQVGVPTAQSLMAQGRVLVSSTGDNNISDFQLALDQNGRGTVSIAPSPTGGKPQVVGTNGWAISANCTNQQQAAAFIDYFINSSEGAATLKGQTGLPPVASILDEQAASPDASDAIKSRIALYRQLLDSGARVDVWPDGTQQLVTQFRTAYEEVAFGRGDPKQVAADFIAQANTALTGF
jgi:multiple sugar transport system substrate-binding protein